MVPRCDRMRAWCDRGSYPEPPTPRPGTGGPSDLPGGRAPRGVLTRRIRRSLPSRQAVVRRSSSDRGGGLACLVCGWSGTARLPLERLDGDRHSPRSNSALRWWSVQAGRRLTDTLVGSCSIASGSMLTGSSQLVLLTAVRETPLVTGSIPTPGSDGLTNSVMAAWVRSNFASSPPGDWLSRIIPCCGTSPSNERRLRNSYGCQPDRTPASRAVSIRRAGLPSILPSALHRYGLVTSPTGESHVLPVKSSSVPGRISSTSVRTRFCIGPGTSVPHPDTSSANRTTHKGQRCRARFPAPDRRLRLAAGLMEVGCRVGCGDSRC